MVLLRHGTFALVRTSAPGGLVHFLHLLAVYCAVAQIRDKSNETTTFLPISNISFTDRLSNKPFLILVIDNPTTP